MLQPGLLLFSKPEERFLISQEKIIIYLVRTQAYYCASILAKNSKLDQFMSSQIRENLQKFFVLGVSYRKTALDVRGRFSLTQMDQEALLRDAKEFGVEGLLVLSTCNRTEIYAHTSDMDIVTKTIPKNFAISHLLLPFNFQNGILEVAVYHPDNLAVLKDIEQANQVKVKPYIAPKSDIKKILGWYNLLLKYDLIDVEKTAKKSTAKKEDSKLPEK